MAEGTFLGVVEKPQVVVAVVRREVGRAEVLDEESEVGVEGEDFFGPGLGGGVGDGEAGFVGGLLGAIPLTVDAVADDAGVLGEGGVGEVEAGEEVGVAGLELDEGFDAGVVIGGQGAFVVEASLVEGHAGGGAAVGGGAGEFELGGAVVLVVGDDLDDGGGAAGEAVGEGLGAGDPPGVVGVFGGQAVAGAAEADALRTGVGLSLGCGVADGG